MKSQSRTNGWKVALGIFLLAACIVALLSWESKGRPGLSNRSVAPSEKADTKMAVYLKLCKGKTLAGEGKHAEALAIFEEISRTEADSEYGWDADIQAAHSMGFLGQHEKALARCDRIIAHCPLEDEIPKVRLVKADIYSLAGQHDQAIKHLEQLIVEYTDTKSLICEQSLIGMTVVYSRIGQFGLMQAVFERIVNDYPGAEASRRKWAKKAIEVAKKKVRELQKTRIDQFLADKEIHHIDKLDPEITTWTAEDGPYLITQPLVLKSDMTLRISAGTQVRFGIDGVIQVEGRLEVIGTQDKPVELVPLSNDPTKDSWTGIEFTTSNGEASRFSYCRFLGANVAINAKHSRLELDHCIFDRCGRACILASQETQLTMNHCTIMNGYRVGVEGESGAVIQIADCRISGLVSHGVALKEVSDKTSFRRVRIEQCGWDGVLVRGRCSPTIDDCQIIDNGGNGIHALEEASPTVSNSWVENNTKAGIRLKEHWGAALRGNTIIDNRFGGIIAEIRCNGEIIDNHIENNGKAGLLLRLDSAPTLTHNRFIKNKGPGLVIQNSQPKLLRDNQFIDNAEAALRNESVGTIKAAYNWWSLDNESEIAKLIQDKDSNPAWGKVEFKPWLTEPPRTQKDDAEK